jgi:hypothetical protein
MEKIEGRSKLVSLGLLQNFEKIGNFVVKVDENSVYKINGFSNEYYTIEDTFGQSFMKAKKDLIDNFSGIFLVSEDFNQPPSLVLFKVDGKYFVSSPMDFIEGPVEEIEQVFGFPDQIGKDPEGNDLKVEDVQKIIFSERISFGVNTISIDETSVVHEPALIDGKILMWTE